MVTTAARELVDPGIGPDTDTVEMTVRDAIALALREELTADERVFIMGEDIGAYGGSYVVTKGFFEEFGEKRIRDTPIAESVIVGSAIGAAMGGLRPIVELMTINFSLLAMDQIVNHAAKILYMSGGQVNVPIVLRMVTGGGSQLGAQHSQNLEAWYARVPGLKVVCPSTPYDALGMMRQAVHEANPYIFVEHSLLYRTKGQVPKGYYVVQPGKSVVRREGKHVTIVGYLRTAVLGLEAADILAKDGIEAEVIDLRSLRPLDLGPVIASVKSTNRAVIAEDAWLTGGFSSEIACQIQEQAFDFLDAPVQRVNGADVPAPYSKDLEDLAYPNVGDIVRAVRSIL
ncbi:MAG: alpha-ketoacid dehydrogenase subunit beta [Dehalococcoidia bacterium]